MGLRQLPAVDRLLRTPKGEELVREFGHSTTLQAVRQSLDQGRHFVLEARGEVPSEAELLDDARRILESWITPTILPVINATGVIIHTNLGRAPLSQSARQAMLQVAGGYSNLEYELDQGKRGRRDHHAEELLLLLTGAEAALVVNNNAAAVLLALTALARRKEVVISRSQLIEIGGGFRIPDVLKQSGAKLVEVGTTNRTHLKDFSNAITPRTALIMLAHTSNFRIVGFTTTPTLSELSALAAGQGIPLLDDLGSGALLDTSQYGLGHEPTVQESLREGASLVAFSGDKLLGGPQAGILVGSKKLVDKLKKHPLYRATRPDKLCLAALSATLIHYVKDEPLEKIPVWQMIAAEEQELRERAHGWREQLGFGEIIQGVSTVGGGSLPEETLPTWLLAFTPRRLDAAAKMLRHGNPPIVSRIKESKLLIDTRTVLPDQEQALLSGLSKLKER
jgi:L-seryl-tRNA(Ser) seleniumtransferase